jgi:hypothetical protein
MYIIVFLKFKNNWFALNHLFKVMKTISMFLFKSGKLECVNKILVSLKHEEMKQCPSTVIMYMTIHFQKWKRCPVTDYVHDDTFINES